MKKEKKIKLFHALLVRVWLKIKLFWIYEDIEDNSKLFMVLYRINKSIFWYMFLDYGECKILGKGAASFEVVSFMWPHGCQQVYGGVDRLMKLFERI